jgi:glutamate-1-semialdehyde 2,1-aminomutase
MRNGLGEIIDRLGLAAMVAGFGSVFTVYFMEPREIRSFDDLLDNDAALYIRYRQELMKRGVFEIPMNLKRNHVSYSHTDDDVEWTLGVAEEAMRAAFDARGGGQI